MKVFELRKKRSDLAAEARKIVELAAGENRDNTDDEKALIEDRMTDIAAVERKIAVMERVEAIESDGGETRGRRAEEIKPTDGPDLDGKVKYSLLRAIRCQMGIERGGLETEVSQEIATRTGKTPQGIFVPWHLATHRDQFDGLPNPERRTTLNITTGAGSIPAILGTDLIDALRNRMVMSTMGARVLTDMTGGTFSLPKLSTVGAAYWVAEATAPTTSNQAITQVTWTPKTVGAYTDVTRKFILQTNQSAEALVREDLSRVIAIELDRVAINGSGSGAQPLGILQDSACTTPASAALGSNGGAETWAGVVALETTIAVANADFGKMGYLSSNKGRGAMKKTPKVGTTYPVFLWENDSPGSSIMNGAQGQVNGYRAMATEQVPSNLTKSGGSSLTAVIFGNFDSATYAFWSGLDILTDPYTGSSTGNVRIVCLQDGDFQMRYEASFCKQVDLDPAA